MFTQAEAQYILNALDLQTKTTGLATAAFALQIVTKLQASLAVQEVEKELEIPAEEDSQEKS